MTENTFEINLYYTSDAGPTQSLRVLSESSDEYLQAASTVIARAYNEVLVSLFAPGAENVVVNRKLQYGFAAACSGLNENEWSALSYDKKEHLRSRYTMVFPLNQRTPNDRRLPNLVLYLGPDRKQPRLSALPSCDLVPHTANNDKFYPWDDAWEEPIHTISAMPCHWGWSPRSHAAHNGASFIFLSGFYALWPKSCGGAGVAQLATPHSKMIETHLKMTLFHELIHQARTILHGTDHSTPEKCIDDPKFVRKRPNGEVVGEAGRLGEKVAFGVMVGLSLYDGELHMYACNHAEPDSTPYALTENNRGSLFHGDIPLSYQQLGPPLHFIPFDERFKGCMEDGHLPVNILLPAGSGTHVVPINLHGMLPITGPLAKLLVEESRAYTRCVEVPDDY